MGMTKSEVMWISRSATRKLDTEINGVTLNHTDSLKYLCAWVTEDGKLEHETQSRSGSAGRVWYNISHTLYDKHIPQTKSPNV